MKTQNTSEFVCELRVWVKYTPKQHTHTHTREREMPISITTDRPTNSSCTYTTIVSSLVLGLGTGILGYFLGKSMASSGIDQQKQQQAHDSDDDDELPYVSESDDEEEEEERLKMVLLVRQDIKGATKGKMMAQCAHASLLAYTSIAERSKRRPGDKALQQQRAWLKRWLDIGCAKIALQCPTLDEAKRLRSEARAINVPAVAVHDAGRTQVDSGTLTVIALGPAPAALVDQVSGHLRLVR